MRLWVNSIAFFLVIGVAFSAPVTKERLRFKVSAKGLPDKDDIGTIDPYVEVYYSEGGSSSEVKLGRSDTITDNENPDWGTVFEFDFDRAKNQKWHFKVFDHDNLREDDKGGQTWVDVTDYVDKGQLINANLDKQGYITIKSVDASIQQNTKNTPGSLPYAPNSPDAGVLTFKVSANGLPDKDNFGRTDPYVEIFSTDGLSGKKVKVGRSGTLSNTKNPSWGDTFTFNWDRRRDQRLYFKVYDDDNLREDDTVGKAWIEVNDYVAKGQVMSVNLNKKGSLTITRADGLPPNPYIPSDGVVNLGPVQNQNSFKNTPPNNPPKGPSPAVLPPVAPPPSSFGQGGVAPVQNNYPVRLRFKLSGNKFPDKDIIGTSDPYAKVFITQDGLAETLLKKGTKLSDNENPQWPDIYEFNYEPAKNQRLRFLILDEDDNRRDDEIGDVTVEGSEIEKKSYIVLPLSEGSLTLTRI